jgi:hypothetical protein
MIERELNTAVQSALAECMVEDSNSAEIASAIARTALFDSESGRQILVMEESDRLIQFDILKAILAAAGVLGATIPLAAGPMIIGPLGIASVLSAISALGALKGLRSTLPRSCAYLVMCLLQEKKMSRDQLQEKFASVYDGPESLAGPEFELALVQLEQVGSIRIKPGEVRLIEHVLVRQ